MRVTPQPGNCSDLAQGGDSDNDGWCDAVDNCPSVHNPDQWDSNQNGMGDACDPDTPVFIRGDANSVTGRDVSDAVTILRLLFLTTDSLDCEKAADVDDSGLVDISDAVFLLRYLFSGGAEIPAPTDCGIDPTPDDLDCGTFDACNG